MNKLPTHFELPLSLLVSGPACPDSGEALYWSNTLGWADRASADRFPPGLALRGLCLHEASGLELAAD